jgi:hypothetical protein
MHKNLTFSTVIISFILKLFSFKDVFPYATKWGTKFRFSVTKAEKLIYLTPRLLELKFYNEVFSDVHATLYGAIFHGPIFYFYNGKSFHINKLLLIFYFVVPEPWLQFKLALF